MPSYHRRIKIAMLGEWPKGSKEMFLRRLRQHKEAEFTTMGSVMPLESGMIPDGFERLKEVHMAQEVSIASQADFAIYGNSGVWGQIKTSHIIKLSKVCPVLVMWTPPGVDDKIPDQSDMASGLVQVEGRTNLLVQIVAYLSLASRQGGAELVSPSMEEDELEKPDGAEELVEITPTEDRPDGAKEAVVRE